MRVDTVQPGARARGISESSNPGMPWRYRGGAAREPGVACSGVVSAARVGHGSTRQREAEDSHVRLLANCGNAHAPPCGVCCAACALRRGGKRRAQGATASERPSAGRGRDSCLGKRAHRRRLVLRRVDASKCVRGGRGTRAGTCVAGTVPATCCTGGPSYNKPLPSLSNNHVARRQRVYGQALRAGWCVACRLRRCKRAQ